MELATNLKGVRDLVRHRNDGMVSQSVRDKVYWMQSTWLFVLATGLCWQVIAGSAWLGPNVLKPAVDTISKGPEIVLLLIEMKNADIEDRKRFQKILEAMDTKLSVTLDSLKEKGDR